jgi:hypothetical protein
MEKKNFLFVSLTGLISDIAWQVSKEGHEVRYFIGDKKERDIADGFVAKSKDWEKDVDWADIIIFDDTLGQGEKAQALRKQGKKVIGGTPYSDRLEDDRSFGQEELKKAGVNIIPEREEAPVRGRRRRRAGRDPHARGLQKGAVRGDQGLPVAAARHGSGSRGGRILQRQEFHLSHQREFRAQEAFSRRHWPADRGDGHVDVLERSKPTV